MKSMTGYGKGQFYENDRKYIVEIKSVNSKYLDVNIKLPNVLCVFEEDIRKNIAGTISRGKVEVSVVLENYSDLGKQIYFDEKFLESFLSEVSNISKKYNIKNDVKMSDVIALSGIVETKTNEESEQVLKQELMKAVNDAINNFLQMRQQEGQQIKDDIIRKIETLQANVEMIEKISYNIVDEYKNKIESRLQKYIHEKDIDKTRLLTEIVIFADKMTIDEEIIRLKSHINQFKKEVNNVGAIGKKLDFIVQEMNRETNTIGSKTNNLEISNLVIDNKGILENIREQIQNIE